MAIIVCKHCNKEFNVPPSRVGKKVYCSSECRKKANANTKTETNCKTCGKPFTVYKHELENGKKYCSKECQNKGFESKVECTCSICGTIFVKRTSSKQIYCSTACRSKACENKMTRDCAICGTPVTKAVSVIRQGRVSLCSPECYSKYFSERMKGEKHPFYSRVKVPCANCGKDVEVPISKAKILKRRFCSESCKYTFATQPTFDFKNPYYEKSEHGYRGRNWKQQRLRALVRDDFKCRVCGVEENLQVHHIKPYTDFEGNYQEANKIGNLMTVCHACHLSIEPRNKAYDNTVVN